MDGTDKEGAVAFGRFVREQFPLQNLNVPLWCLFTGAVLILEWGTRKTPEFFLYNAGSFPSEGQMFSHRNVHLIPTAEHLM